MKYQANPVIVDGFKIVGVGRVSVDGGVHLELENGEDAIATAPMVSRMMPEPGDYWVIQEDGYTYVNPREVFERKYSPVAEVVPA